jgi:hypothetical protein
MKNKIDLLKDESMSQLLSDKALPVTNEAFSATEGSFFEEEDQNLIENKELYNKQNIISGKVSFIDKFEFIKNSNYIYKFYTNKQKSFFGESILLQLAICHVGHSTS